jgi:biopolymer transport protein ExbB
MFDYDNAGLIGYAIVALSILALALVIENFVVVRRERLAAPKLVEELDSLFGEENWPAAAELCERDGSYLARCVAAGLLRLQHPFDTVLTAVREMETEEVVKLFQKIGWLSLVSAIAPMLGLFGTVTGMFVTFGTIARHGGSVSPATLAGGIKMALITTIFGLTVAIPVGVCFFVLKQRVIRLATETNAIAEDLFERFRKS